MTAIIETPPSATADTFPTWLETFQDASAGGPVDAALKVLDPYFNGSEILMRNEEGKWERLQEKSARLWLRAQGLRGKKADGEELSEVDQAIYAIQRKRSVDYSGPLAGYDAGIYDLYGNRVLVTKSPKLVVPAKGDFPNIRAILENLLGGRDSQQLTHFLGWLQISLNCLFSKKHQFGQAVVFAGPRECGKTLVQKLLTVLFGGRVAKPYPWMSGRTDFNGDLFEAEHLVIADEVANFNFPARRRFGAMIKQVAAEMEQQCHRKYSQALVLPPFWRLTISVNDEPENLIILPPLEKSINDKMMIFKATKYPMPMPTGDQNQKAAFWSTLISELPAFVHHVIHEFQIPPELRHSRYGINPFFHPDIVAAIDDLAPELRLLELIDTWFHITSTKEPRTFTAAAFQMELESHEALVKETNRVLSFYNACGSFLNKLSISQAERVQDEKDEKARLWRICPPGWVESDLKYINKIARAKKNAAGAE